MVIDNFNVCRVSGLKTKAQTPLIVDTNAPLSGAVAREFFQTVAGRNAQKIKRCGGMKLLQLAHGDDGKGIEPHHAPPLKQSFRIGTMEIRNHGKIITEGVIIVELFSQQESYPEFTGKVDPA
jgi:hypothetical protein